MSQLSINPNAPINAHHASLSVYHNRNIAAPFQLDGPMTPRGALDQCSLEEKHFQYTYMMNEFPQLDTEDVLTYDKYCGPTPESNWVIPGVLLVGAYPASENDSETCELLSSILTCGVNKFVCLQAEYRANVTEVMWRQGSALRPYFDDVKLLLSNKSMFPVLRDNPSVSELENMSFEHFPIRDCSVTDDTRVLQLALRLVEEIAKGKVLYLHCWGGHGRTGTVVSIMLHLMYGFNSTASMRRCQLVHDIRQCPVVVDSPQTQTQRDQVHRVIAYMQKQALKFKYLKKTMIAEKVLSVANGRFTPRGGGHFFVVDDMAQQNRLPPTDSSHSAVCQSIKEETTPVKEDIIRVQTLPGPPIALVLKQMKDNEDMTEKENTVIQPEVVGNTTDKTVVTKPEVGHESTNDIGMSPTPPSWSQSMYSIITMRGSLKTLRRQFNTTNKPPNAIETNNATTVVTE